MTVYQKNAADWDPYEKWSGFFLDATEYENCGKKESKTNFWTLEPIAIQM